MEFAVALGLTSLYIRIPKRHERNPGKMTFTTASGLLPAGIAVYVQRGPNGIGLETRYPVGLEDLTSLWERGRSNSLRQGRKTLVFHRVSRPERPTCQLGKMNINREHSI